MALTLRELETLGPGGTILSDRPCRRCGYNLKGLTTKQQCPECGLNIKLTPRQARENGLTQAARPYLAELRRGAFVLAGAAAIGAVTVFLAAFLQEPRILMVAALAALLWFAGVWMVTGPRQGGEGSAVPVGDHRALRWTARLFQFLWLPAATPGVLLALGSGGGSMLPVWLSGPLLASGLLAWLGIAVLFFWMAVLADWGYDESTATRLRMGFWLLLAAPLAMVVGWVLGYFLSLWAGQQAEVVGLACGLVAAMVAPGWLLWQCVTMCRWAWNNAMAADEKDERLRERARVALATGTDPARGPAQRICRKCGYDVTALVRSPVCPECGASIL